MITYAYWLLILGISSIALYLLGFRLDKWKPAVLLAVVILVVGFLAYEFRYRNMFVKRWGGVMSVTVPEGQRHIATTWKEDSLWIENYDPVKNECIFAEVSRTQVLEGKVVIKNCNPVGVKASVPVE